MVLDIFTPQLTLHKREGPLLFPGLFLYVPKWIGHKKNPEAPAAQALTPKTQPDASTLQPENPTIINE